MTIRNPTPGMSKTMLAGAAVIKARIVKFGADEDHVVQSTAVSETLIGVADTVGAANAEENIDVHFAGIATVEYGGTVAAGNKLTTDASGRAVAAAPAAGTNNGIIGIALVAGVVGDWGAVLLAQSTLQG